MDRHAERSKLGRGIGLTIIISGIPSIYVIHSGKFRCSKADNFVGRALLAKSQSFRKVTLIYYSARLYYAYLGCSRLLTSQHVDQFEQVSYDIMRRGQYSRTECLRLIETAHVSN